MPHLLMTRFSYLLVCLLSITQLLSAQSPLTSGHASTRAVTTTLAPDTSLRSVATSHPQRSIKTITIDREVFQYTATSRRDPFGSLLNSNQLRPLLSDLRLTTIAYDPSGRNSVAILRDLETKQQYRTTRGSQLGRMRIVRIDQRSVTFMLEEYGFSRQETLMMSDTSVTNSR